MMSIKVGRDRVDQPGDDHTIHAGPRGVVRERGVAEDVVLQSNSTKNEEHMATPFGEVRGLEIQNNWNEIPDVLDGGGLAVQSGDDRGIGDEEGVVVFGLGVVVAGPVVAGAAPESHGPLLEDVGLRALFLESVGGGADAVLGGGSGLEEFGVLQELLAALGVGGAQGGDLFFKLLGSGEGSIAELSRGSRSRNAGGGVAEGDNGATAEEACSRGSGWAGV
jgi:hypothetical protein